MYLSCSDVKMLAETCKWFKEFINRNYVESVILPLSLKNQNKLSGRSILSITSSFDVVTLREGEYLSMIKNMQFLVLKLLMTLVHDGLFYVTPMEERYQMKFLI